MSGALDPSPFPLQPTMPTLLLSVQDIIWWKRNMTQERVVICLADRMTELLLPWPELLPSTLIQKRSCILHKFYLPQNRAHQNGSIITQMPATIFQICLNYHILTCCVSFYLWCTKTSTIDNVTGSKVISKNKVIPTTRVKHIVKHRK